jgi:hypothetical protein
LPQFGATVKLTGMDFEGTLICVQESAGERRRVKREAGETSSSPALPPQR